MVRAEAVSAARHSGVGEMSNTNTGGPAFPSLPIVQEFEGKRLTMTEGLTMRDYFAAKAMQTVWATLDPEMPFDVAITETAGAAYELADAMLRAREQ
jgi:hypothetical protein